MYIHTYIYTHIYEYLWSVPTTHEAEIPEITKFSMSFQALENYIGKSSHNLINVF